jgi:hypothetical protein
MRLIAVGDRLAKIARFSPPRSNEGQIDWPTRDLAELSDSMLPKHDPQIEAISADGLGRMRCFKKHLRVSNSSTPRRQKWSRRSISRSRGAAKIAQAWSDPEGSRGEGMALLPGGHLLVAKEKKPSAFIEFGPSKSQSQGLAYGGALADGGRWPIKKGHHRFVALAIWLPDKTLAKTCAEFSDLGIGPDGCLYLISDKSSTIARLDALLPGGGAASLLDAWRLGDLDGKPEGLAFIAQGQAVVGLDRRKARRNLVLL